MNFNSDIAYHNLQDTCKSLGKVQPEVHIQSAAYFYKVFLANSHIIHSCIVYGYFCTITADLNSGDKDCMDFKI